MIAAVERPPDHKVCSKCTERKPIDEFWRSQHGKHRLRSECKACKKHAERDRRRAELKSRTKRALSLRLSAAALLHELRALAKAHGGKDKLYRSLSTHDAAQAYLRISEAAAAAKLKAEEEDRQAKVDLQTPGMERALQQMAVEYLFQHPEALAPLLPRLLAQKPSLLTPEILDSPAVKGWLSRCGYRREQLDS